MGAPVTVVARVTVAATGMVGGTTAGVATTVAATAIVHRPQVRDPEVAMVPAPAVAGMAIPAVAVADHVPALDPVARAAVTEETAVSVVVVTEDRVAAIAESQQNGAPRSAVFYGIGFMTLVKGD